MDYHWISRAGKWLGGVVLLTLVASFLSPVISDVPRHCAKIAGKCPIFFPIALALFAVAGALYYCIRRFSQAGILRVEFSLTSGRGGCRQILKRARTGFWFLGITARRWFQPDHGRDFEEMAHQVGVATETPIRLLVLDPESDFVMAIAALLREDPEQIKERIKETIRCVQKLSDSGIQIELRGYKQRPVFRVAVINEREAYLSFYKPVAHKDRQPALVLNHHRGQSFYVGVIEHFQQVWNSAKVLVSPPTQGQRQSNSGQ